MKILITENQYKRLFEQEQEVFHIPLLKLFNYDWDLLQMFLNKKGNPPYSIGGDLNLRNTPIQSLGNLQSVGGNLYLENTPIQSLGNLESVGGDLDLENTPIQSLGNLESVGGYLDLENTPISKMYSKEQIKQMINVKGKIFI
jgi:hypothetical protein